MEYPKIDFLYLSERRYDCSRRKRYEGLRGSNGRDV